MTAHNPHGADRWHMEAEERRRQGFVAVASALAAVVALPVLLAVAIALIARMTIG